MKPVPVSVNLASEKKLSAKIHQMAMTHQGLSDTSELCCPITQVGRLFIELHETQIDFLQHCDSNDLLYHFVQRDRAITIPVKTRA